MLAIKYSQGCDTWELYNVENWQFCKFGKNKQRLSKFSSYLSNKTKQRLSKFRKP